MRHARNALLRVPDDVRELGQPLLPPLAAGVLLTLPPGAQLLPCVLLLPGRPDTECRRRRLAPIPTRTPHRHPHAFTLAVTTLLPRPAPHSHLCPHPPLTTTLAPSSLPPPPPSLPPPSARLLLFPPPDSARSSEDADAAHSAERSAVRGAERSAERGAEPAFRRDLLLLVAISAQIPAQSTISAQADASPAATGSPVPAARRGSAAFDVATSWMPASPAALASPSEGSEGSPAVERRPRERRPSGDAAGAAGAVGARVLLALPLHAITLSRVASAGGGRIVVSVVQHGQVPWLWLAASSPCGHPPL